MWPRAWLVLSVSTSIWAQHTHTAETKHSLLKQNIAETYKLEDWKKKAFNSFSRRWAIKGQRYSRKKKEDLAGSGSNDFDEIWYIEFETMFKIVGLCLLILAITRVSQNGGAYEWGWQQQQDEDGGAIGHYYVKLPQSQQQVRYSADDSGYHGAVAVNTGDGNQGHSHTFALGARALELHAQAQKEPNVSHLQPAQSQRNPVDIFLLHQSYPSPQFVNEQLILPVFHKVQYGPNTDNYNNPDSTQVNFNIQTQHAQQTQNTQPHTEQNTQHERKEGTYEILYENESSRSSPLSQEGYNEQRDFSQSVVQVFKDVNCTHGEDIKKKSNDKTTKLYAKPEAKTNFRAKMERPTSYGAKTEIPTLYGAKSERPTSYRGKTERTTSYRAKTERPLSYRGAVTFKVEPQRQNARSERYYYTTDSPTTSEKYYYTTDSPTTNDKYYYTTDSLNNQRYYSTVSTTARTTTEDERISRLVASTQDLISNEDLLKINHAEEKHVGINTDDVIKPRPRFNLRAQETKYSTPRSRITVKAHIGKIVDSDIEHVENNYQKDQILDDNANDYKFASPIVVQDNSYNDYKEQIVNNLVSTMVPYIADGYEIVGVRDSSNESRNNDNNNDENNDNSDEDLVNVTPRPLGQKYLAPITVALRLLNANESDSFNYIDDHEGSDSEIYSQTVKKPSNERTVVEVQKSIPVSITHYNGVEVHQYLEEGRSNQKGPMDYAKTLYNKYVQALGIKSSQNSANDILRNYNSEKNYHNDEKYENTNEKDHDTSENVQSEIEVRPNNNLDAETERHEYVRDYYDHDNQKIIQPIIIEKEVPVTQFVDRYIEKPVPTPVAVDRPVPYPVHYEKIVDRPVEVTRYVDKPYPVEVPRPYPVEVKVPYPVEQKVYVDRPVHVPYPVEKVYEKQVLHPVPIPTPVAVPVEVQVPVERQVLYPVPIETPVPVPVEVEKPVPVEKVVTKEVPVPVAVETKVPYPVPYETKVPVPYAVEKRVPVPVDRIVEKPVTITKIVEKPIHIEVPVPQPIPVPIHVHHHVPVDRIVEKKVPYPVHVDHIVEKKVPVQVPYPVEKIVEKVVEKPVIVNKYIEKPYPVEKRVPYPVEKIVEKKVPVPIHVPYEVRVPYPVEHNPERHQHNNNFNNKVPYTFEKPYSIYGYAQGSDSQNYPQYLKYTADQHKNGIPPPHIQNQLNKNQLQHLQAQYDQYYQNLRNKQQNTQTTSTHWGNLYASSYQHINNTPESFKEFKKTPPAQSYINYLSNQNQNHQSMQYYGPPPVQNSVDEWEKHKNFVVELKLRRNDRTPKSSVRIEYGGFKPPLIPSTEVDLDGIPINKDSE